MSSTVLTAERADVARPRFRRASAIPGFGLAFGYTLLYLGLIVLLPLAALVVRASSLGVSGFWAALTTERVVAALTGGLGLAFAARRGGALRELWLRPCSPAGRSRLWAPFRLGVDALPFPRPPTTGRRRIPAL